MWWRALMVCLVWPTWALAAFVHPSLLNTDAELTYVAGQINAGVQPWKNAYDNWLPASASYVPQSPTTPNFPTGSFSGDEDKLQDDCHAAYSAAWKWVVKGQAGDAAKALELLNYVTRITSIIGGDRGFRTAITVRRCIYAADIMANRYTGWSAGQVTTFKTWLRNVINPIVGLEVASLNNRGIVSVTGRLAVAVFLDDTPLYDAAITSMKTLIRDTIGKQTVINANVGFYRETCRNVDAGTNNVLTGGDMTHTQLAFQGFLEAATIAKHQGQDLYTYLDPLDGMGLEQTLDYHDQWIFFDERATSSQTGWPCALDLDNLQRCCGHTEIWRMAYHQYGKAAYLNVAEYSEAEQCATFDCFYPLSHNTSGMTPGGDTTAPNAPTLPTAVANSASQITVSWTASTSPDATSYLVEHCAGAGCSGFTQLAIDSASPYVHSGLVATSLHRYRISASDNVPNTSAPAGPVEATTLAATQPPPSGTNWYVATTGNNAHAGTIIAPFATLGQACSVVQPGDTIFLRGGTYTFAGNPIGGCPNGTSWDKAITFRSYPGEVVTTTGYGWNLGEPLTPKRYWIIEGEHRPDLYNAVTNVGGKGWVFDAQDFDGYAHHIRWKHLEIKNGGDVGALGTCDFCELLDLNVHHNGTTSGAHGFYGHSCNMLVDGGEYHHNRGYGMQIYHADGACLVGKCTVAGTGADGNPKNCGLMNNVIRNVRVHANGLGGFYMGAHGSNSLMYNIIGYRGDGTGVGVNGAYGPGGTGGGAINAGTPGQYYNITLYGNTANTGSECPATQLLVRAPCDNCTVRNVLTSGTATAKPLCAESGASNPIMTHNLNTANPLFVNANARDFHLQSGSPAINQGFAVNIPMVANDFDGATRPVGSAWDIGAYEFGGAPPACTKPGGDCTPPPVPNGLTATRDSTTQATLNWNDSTGASGYQVRQCEVPTAQSTCTPATVIASPTASDQVVTGLTPGKTYAWTASALDANANESDSSSAVALTMSTPVADTEAPTVPTGLACTTPSATQASCTWTASTDLPAVGSAGVAGYRVQSCQGVACTPADPFELVSASPSTKANLSASTTYGFRVAAVDAASPANASAYSTPIVYLTTPAAPTVREQVYLLNNSCADTGSPGGANCTPVGTTFTATDAVFDAATDAITVPLAGFVGPANTTLVVAFRAETAFVAGQPRGIYEDTTLPAYANRRQLYAQGDRLAIGLGSTHLLNPDVLGTALALNTWYHVVLRLHPDGTYAVTVLRDGTGIITTAAGTYTGLTTLAATGAIGNNGGSGGEGWRGSIGEVRLINRVWSEAEIDAYCTANVPGCPGVITPPPYDPPLLVSGSQGDGVAAASNTAVSVLMAGTTGPDPAICLPLSDWVLTYGAQIQPIATCAVNGTTLQLSVNVPPPDQNTVIALTYAPTSQQITLTNQTVITPVESVAFEQRQWLCRRPGISPLIHWQGPINSECHVPSPGAIDVQVDLVWAGQGPSPVQNYALWCDATPDDSLDQAVRVGAVFDQYGTLPLRYAPQGSQTQLLADGAAITAVMQGESGAIPVAGGTMRRQEAAVGSPSLQPNEAIEYRFALQVAAGIAANTTFACDVRPTQGSAPLGSVVPARLRVGAAQFVSQ